MALHASLLQALLVDERFQGDVRHREPMSRHTTFRIGGPAEYAVNVDSTGSLMKLVDACEQTSTPWVVIGRGSNLLVADEGFAGVVITLGRDFRTCRFDEETTRFCVGAGVGLSQVVQEAFKKSLEGLEFAVGTPGTVGGALRMNAGTPEHGVGERAVSVTTLLPEEGLRRYGAHELSWGYRKSPFAEREIIVECELGVHPADSFYIRGKMEASLAKRRRTQPLAQATCGSVFKNPEGHRAAELIEQVGLKGRQIGGARISDVHANFIVNADNASAYDVLALIKLIRTKVFETYGIELQPEVRLLGFPR